MEQSASISKLAQALCRFQQKCHTVEFDSTVKVATSEGSQYSFRYASYPKIVAAIRPVLTECCLAFSQLTEPDGSVTTLLIHESGEYLKSTLLIPTVHKNPQYIGSAISYARRYALSAILGLATDEDDDGNAASGNIIKEKKTIVKNGVPEKMTVSYPTDARPWLNALQLEKVIQRMKASEAGVYEKTVKAYRIRRSYKEQLNELRTIQSKNTKH